MLDPGFKPHGRYQLCFHTGSTRGQQVSHDKPSIIILQNSGFKNTEEMSPEDQNRGISHPAYVFF